jgi:sugar lactone lactonase YvrE
MFYWIRKTTPFFILLAVLGCSEKEEQRPAVQVLATGAQVCGANGIHFGPDGKLYIASVLTPTIAVMDPESGEIEKRLGPDQGVKGPDDLAFGPDGSLYWTEIIYGEVGRLTPNGVSTVVADLGPGVNPITFSDDGRLFVSQCFFDDKLYELDPTGAREPRLITDQLGPGCGLNGMDWGPDGFLYGPRWFQGEVVRVNVETGEFHTVVDDFGVPAAIKFDSQGRLHVLDALAGEVVQVDLESGTKEVVGRIEPRSADNLAFDESDRLFVSSYTDGYIVEILDKNSNRTVSPGGLTMPGGIDLVETEEGDRLFITNFFSLRELDAITGQERGAVRDLIGFSQLGSVMSVRSDGKHLVVTSWFDNHVKIWDPNAASLIATFEGIAQPVDAMFFLDDIVVTEFQTGNVVRLDPRSPERRTVIASGLQAPAGLASAGESLYVSDRTTGQILHIMENGEELQSPSVLADGLEGPEGMDIGEDGRIFVVEADAGRVVSIDRLTGSIEVLAEGLDLHLESQGNFPATMVFNGLVVGTESAFVTGDKAGVLYRIDL